MLEARQLLATATPAPSPIAPPPPIVQQPANPAPVPRVAFAQLEPLTGRVLVSFTGDLAGYNTSTLTDPANYSLTPVTSYQKPPRINPSRPSAGVVLAPTFRVTGATLTNLGQAGAPQQVILSINNNQPIRDGIYLFTIHSAAIADNAGRQLDGEYDGVFPSGDGRPGGDFVAYLSSGHNTVNPAAPVTASSTPQAPGTVNPTYVFVPPVHEVRIGYTSAKPGGFMLAGQKKPIKLYVFPGQHYPGNYRPPFPKV